MSDQPPGPRFRLSTLLAGIGVACLLLPALLHLFLGREAFDHGTDIIAITYLLGLSGYWFLLLWRCDWEDRWLLWIGGSLPLGLLGWTIPFGATRHEIGLGGQGLPLPVVIFESGVDYPAPISFVLNPICVFAVGVLAFGVVYAVNRIR